MNFSLLKQRLVGKAEKESDEFKAKRKTCMGMRDDLVKAQKAIQLWLEGI